MGISSSEREGYRTVSQHSKTTYDHDGGRSTMVTHKSRRAGGDTKRKCRKKHTGLVVELSESMSRLWWNLENFISGVKPKIPRTNAQLLNTPLRWRDQIWYSPPWRSGYEPSVCSRNPGFDSWHKNLQMSSINATVMRETARSSNLQGGSGR